MIVRTHIIQPINPKGTTPMTIKINVGVNKKIGLPDYGSAGGHCNIEIEADNSVLNDAEEFLQRVRDAYEVARMSVEEELSHHRPSSNGNAQSRAEPQQQRQEQRQEYRNDNSRSDNNSGGNRYIASAKQQDYISRLVGGIRGLDWQKVDKFCTTKFGKPCSQLSGTEASAFIDDLKAAKSGGRGLA
jgi:hypothetical protein